MKTISTEKAPQPGGHYSQAIVHNGWVFVSGQIPVKPGSHEKVLGSIEEQTQQVLQNIKAILEEANSSINQVLKVTIYISDMELWGKVNEVYKAFFGDHRPARAVVPTRELHYGFKVELEAIAALNP